MLEAASSDPEITKTYEVFSNDEHLFNIKNGTFDLKQQTLREHRRKDYITKVANASLCKDAECNRWLVFIEEVTGRANNPILVR